MCRSDVFEELRGLLSHVAEMAELPDVKPQARKGPLPFSSSSPSPIFSLI
jgi:hypothetical protein